MGLKLDSNWQDDINLHFQLLRKLLKCFQSPSNTTQDLESQKVKSKQIRMNKLETLGIHLWNFLKKYTSEAYCNKDFSLR